MDWKSEPGARRGRVCPRRVAGVTLLELMAVVLVIGILGVIALPSYRQYVMRAQRTDAKSALLRLATNQERFYLQNRTYGGNADFAALGFATAALLSEKSAYTIAIAGNDANGYTATATPIVGGAFNMVGDAECASFTINAQGVRTAAPDPTQRCW